MFRSVQKVCKNVKLKSGNFNSMTRSFQTPSFPKQYPGMSYGMPYGMPYGSTYPPGMDPTANIRPQMTPDFGLANQWVDKVSAMSSPSWAWSGITGGNKNLMMTRWDVVMLLLCAKKQKGLSFRNIAEKLGFGEVWITAAILGQHSLKKDDAEKLCSLLEMDKKLTDKVCSLLTEPPMRGIPYNAVMDPTIYRFFEVMLMYGTTFKSLMFEKFGDSVISSVDLKMDVQPSPDDSKRVRVTFDAAVEDFKPF